MRCTNQHVEQANVGDSRHVALSIPSMTQQTANDSMRAAKRSGIDTMVEGCAFSASPASSSRASMPTTSQTNVGMGKARERRAARSRRPNAETNHRVADAERGSVGQKVGACHVYSGTGWMADPLA